MRKLTATQRAVLTNALAGRQLDHGRAVTQSASAGWGCSIHSCMRAGWLSYPEYALTNAGRAALGIDPA